MNPFQQFQEDAKATEPDINQYLNVIGPRLQDYELLRLLHGAMGLCTEAGEFQDILKRHIFYGKELDRSHLFEEGGDILWYIRIIADSLRDLRQGKCSFEEMLISNVSKLKARFPKKFSEQSALNRDLDAEKKAMEGT